MCVTKVIFLIAIYLQYNSASGRQSRHVDTQEAFEGETAILHCKSCDKSHNFMFWHLAESGVIIGPRNEFDLNKFSYEVLSGNLTIRSVTTHDGGLYNCISDGLTTRDILANSVNFILKTNGGEIVEHNSSGNLWKTCAVLGSILVILIIIGVVLHIYHKRTEKLNYFGIVQNNDDEEDSTEELFTRQPSTSGIKSNPDTRNASDNFEKLYTVINVKNTN